MGAPQPVALEHATVIPIHPLLRRDGTNTARCSALLSYWPVSTFAGCLRALGLLTRGDVPSMHAGQHTVSLLCQHQPTQTQKRTPYSRERRERRVVCLWACMFKGQNLEAIRSHWPDRETMYGLLHVVGWRHHHCEFCQHLHHTTRIRAHCAVTRVHRAREKASCRWHH